MDKKLIIDLWDEWPNTIDTDIDAVAFGEALIARVNENRSKDAALHEHIARQLATGEVGFNDLVGPIDVATIRTNFRAAVKRLSCDGHHPTHEEFARRRAELTLVVEAEAQEPVSNAVIHAWVQSLNKGVERCRQYADSGDAETIEDVIAYLTAPQPPAPCPACASGILCADCNDTGWLENREEGRYPCTCMTGAEPYQLLQAKVAEQAALIDRCRDALSMPCDRWNKRQAMIVNEILEAIAKDAP